MISNADSKKVQNLLLRSEATIVLKSEGKELKILGKTKIITPQDEKFKLLAEKIWALHPTYYGNFQEILIQWKAQCVIIEIEIVQVME